jgi:hypothetical protein
LEYRRRSLTAFSEDSHGIGLSSLPGYLFSSHVLFKNGRLDRSWSEQQGIAIPSDILILLIDYMFNILGELLDIVSIHDTSDTSADGEDSDLARGRGIENDIWDFVSRITSYTVGLISICAVVKEGIKIWRHLCSGLRNAIRQRGCLLVTRKRKRVAKIDRETREEREATEMLWR